MSEVKSESKQEKPKEIIYESNPVTDNKTEFFVDKLSDLANNTTYKNYEKLLITAEYTSEGNDGSVTYKSRFLQPQERGQLRRLVRQSVDINKKLIAIEADGNYDDKEYDKLWTEYLDVTKKQGKLLIKDLTDEQFNNSDFYVLENLIVAWRMKYQGFREL